MPHLYIIAGPNGAGKTTASFTLLPQLLGIKEFVNADEIARGLSPFQPGTVSIEAGKIMLRRIESLLSQQLDFAFETTLATRSFVNLVKEAKATGYFVTLIYYWLENADLAIERVKTRVSEGGHHIPEETIVRRYSAGLKNFLHLYKDIVDYWILIDNSKDIYNLIAEGEMQKTNQFYDIDKWNLIKSSSKQ